MSPAIHVLFLFISFGWEIIEPEAEVMDIVKVSAHAMYLYSQPTQARNPFFQGTLHLVTTVYLITRKTVVAKDLVFFNLHIYTRV